MPALEYSGFAQLMPGTVDRKVKSPVHSSTTSLFQGGVPRSIDKIVEEAHKVVEPGGSPSMRGNNMWHLKWPM